MDTQLQSTNDSDSPDPVSADYERFCRPRTGDLLRSLRLDKHYESAAGDTMRYVERDGRESAVLDVLGGYGAALLGHNHPELVCIAVEALTRHRPFHAQKSARGPAAQLCRRLSEVVGSWTGQHYVVSLANGGAEAVEAAIKHALLAWRTAAAEHVAALQRATQRVIQLAETAGDEFAIECPCDDVARTLSAADIRELDTLVERLDAHNRALLSQPASFLVIEGAFHGLTTGALQLTGSSDYRDPFACCGLDVHSVPLGEVVALERAVESTQRAYLTLQASDKRIRVVPSARSGLAAMFVEPLLGEGGVHEVPSDFLRTCRELATRHGFALVLDEIQSGMGRTGTFLHSQQHAVIGDYYLLGKALGGGLAKISALLVERRLYRDEFSRIHGSTYAEDDFSSLVALGVLDIIERDGLAERCAATGAWLRARMQEQASEFADVVQEVRGAGLMLGIQIRSFDGARSRVLRLLSEQGLLGYVVSGYLLHEHRVRIAPTLSQLATIRIQPSAYLSRSQGEQLLRALHALWTVLRDENVLELLRYLVNLEGTPTANASPTAVRPRSVRVCHGAALDAMSQVGFVAHLASADDLDTWDDGLRELSIRQKERLLDRLHLGLDPTLHDRVVIRSATGGEVCLNIIGICADARIMSRRMGSAAGRAGLQRQLNQALQLAEGMNIAMLGFGGYTSIASGNCQLLKSERVALTTGNSLTVAMGLQAIRGYAGVAGIHLPDARCAIVGATGNIASIYAELLAEQVREVLLIGRPGSERRLESVAKRVKACPVAISTDIDAVRGVDIVLSASNAPEPILGPSAFGTQPTVVCDISVPPDVNPSVARLKPNIVVLQGGVVQLPNNPDFHPPGSPLPPGCCYACLAETLVLGLSGIRADFSRGAIDRAKVDYVATLAEVHGMRLADLALQRQGYNTFSRTL